MKQILKKLFLRLGVWDRITSGYHSVRRRWKHAIQKERDFEQYVYPVIGRHPAKGDVFLVLSPTYKNLGDHAIAKAEMELLRQWGIPCREVTIDLIQTLAKHDDYGVFGRGTVLVTGGGFLGTLWPHMHEMTTRMIEDNPRAKIVILPNTFYFDRTPAGEQLYEASLDTFNRTNVRRVYLREKLSYDMLQGKCAAAKLMPDMVMSMNESRPGVTRSGCLICLRDDKEKTLTDAQTVVAYDSVMELFGGNVTKTDMRNATDVALDERQEKLEQKFDQFRQAELVITDRLHGMVFSAITGTPCIVMNSRSHKLVGCYEWLKDLDYVRFCDDAAQISRIWAQMPREERRYDTAYLKPWFDEMRSELNAIIRE